MKRLSPAKFLATAALALGALGAVTAAQARSDVQFSIGVQVPGVYAQPAPVYMEQQPVYVQPQPVYVQPRPVYVQPRPVYAQPAYPTQVYVNPAWGAYGRSYDNDRDWRRAEWRRRQWERHHRWEERREHDRDWD